MRDRTRRSTPLVSQKFEPLDLPTYWSRNVTLTHRFSLTLITVLLVVAGCGQKANEAKTDEASEAATASKQTANIGSANIINADAFFSIAV